MKQKNRKKRLAERIKGYEVSMKTHNGLAFKVQNRKEEGGFHKPGSNNK